jgi:hypothetical protein
MVCVLRAVSYLLCISKPLFFVLVQALCSYTIPKENKFYEPVLSNKPPDVNLDPQLLGIDTANHQAASSSLRLFPPPLFSRQAIPQGYKCIYFIPEAS